MTFKDVVIKNFLGGMQKYLAYYLCSSFCIIFFFMYATIIFNKNLSGRDDTDVLSYVFPVTIVAISLFSIFFINYAHTAFLKGRNKEFGIYISLGMHSKELSKLVMMENVLIACASIVSGLLVGGMFARLFQMAILDLLEIENIVFTIDYKAFLVSILVFVLIFVINIVVSSRKIGRSDISALLQEVRKGQGKKYSGWHLLLGVFGIILLVVSLMFLLILTKNKELTSNMFLLLCYILVAFFGVYLTIAFGGNVIIHLVKKSKSYYKNMLTVTEIHYKYNQNKKLMFILSVLSTMTIFLVASPFSLLNLCETLAELNKTQLEVVETSNINKDSKELLEKLIPEDMISLQDELNFVFLSKYPGESAIDKSVPILSEKIYNDWMGTNYSIARGECMNVILSWMPENGGYEVGDTLTVYDKEQEYSYKVISSTNGTFAGNSFPSDTILLLSDEDFNKLHNVLSEEQFARLHLLQFKEWKDSRIEIKAVTEALKDSEIKPYTIVAYYNDLKKGYSVFLFVSSVLGILFFVAGGSVLYFKQYTELPETKKTFYKIFKIGISEKETKAMIGKQLLVIFFVPLIFGTFLGFSLMYLMTHIVGGSEVIKEFMKNACVVVAIYFISQSIFYQITKKKYMKELSAMEE